MHQLALTHIDVFVFLGFITYVTVCVIFAVIDIEIECCKIQFIHVATKRTSRRSMLFLAWLISMFVICLYMQILVLAPDYGAFGGQEYIHDGENRDCTFADVGLEEGLCMMTEVSTFILRQNVMLPFLGFLFFVGSTLFYIMFLVYSICGLRRCKRTDYVELNSM